MSNVNLFLKQCKALVFTLTEAKEIENSRLDMSDWVKSFNSPLVKHFCNTVACVCGYQAISKRLEYFIQTDEDMYPQQIAIRISLDLVNACPEDGKLAHSIFVADRDKRLWAATGSGLFSKRELKNSNHLNKNEPSFDDAIEYINVCIKKVKKTYL
jgi:hypothetical protein